MHQQVFHIQGVTVNGRPLTIVESTPDPEPVCFVCGRITDHFAEHDDLVEQGRAIYGPDGSVHWAERYQREG